MDKICLWTQWLWRKIDLGVNCLGCLSVPVGGRGGVCFSYFICNKGITANTPLSSDPRLRDSSTEDELYFKQSSEKAECHS